MNTITDKLLRRQNTGRRSRLLRWRARSAADPFASAVTFVANFNGTNGQQVGYSSEFPVIPLINLGLGTGKLDNTHVDGGTTALLVGTVTGSFATNAAYDLATGDADPYTIEWSQYLPNLVNTCVMLQPNWNINGWMIRADTTTFDFFWIDQASVSRSRNKAAAGFIANQMQRCAVSKDSSRVLRFFIDGTKVDEVTLGVGTAGIKPVTGPLLVGGNAAGYWIDRTRLTRACRYTANYDAWASAGGFPTP